MTIKKAGFYFVLLVSLGILWGFYSDILLAPNSYMFNQNGDAFKNYYSIFNHVNNDDNLMHSRNVNYPNGELIVFMDGQFAVSNGLYFLSHFFPGIAHYSVGILNLLMLLSIPFGALLLYQLLLHYKVEAQFAVVGALGLMLMQPQIFRLHGHFALGYAFVIPLSWLLFEKYRQSRSAFWLILLLWANTTFFFTHPYLGLIVTLFELLVVFISWFFLKNKVKKILNMLLQMVWLVLPIILFSMVVTWLDYHVGRSNNPYGIFVYQASLQTIFLPILPPFNSIVNEYFFSFNQNWEGWSYIGIANIIGVITLFFFIIRKSKRQELGQNSQFKTFLPVLIAGWIIMLYSIGIPVNILGRDIVDNLPIIKQFRSLGRFAWVFYYVTGVSTIILIQQFVSREKMKFVLFGLVGLMMIIEGYSYHSSTVKSITQGKNLFVEEYSPREVNQLVNHIDSSAYQAILPLPFYMIGSGNMMVAGTNESAILSQLISARKNLPLIGGMLSRTSIPETKESITLLSPSFYPKPILDKFDPVKPILISYTGQDLSTEQQGILNRSKLIYTNEYGSLHSIFPGQLYTCPADSLKNIQRSFAEYTEHRNCWTSDSTGYYFLSEFNDQKSKHILLGNGAMQQPKNGYRVLGEFKPLTFKKGVEYEFTVWCYNKDEGRIHELIGLHYYTPKSENAGWLTYTNTKFSETIFGNWSLVRIKFTVEKPENIIKVLVEGNRKNMDMYYDNLLLREMSVTVVQKTVFEGDSVIVINNDILPFCENP